jgi:hypothetical protein
MRVNNNDNKIPASLKEANTVNLRALDSLTYSVMYSLDLKKAEIARTIIITR